MSDETAIRDYHAKWVRATTEGDLELARSLIDDDAVFLMPGAEPMGKEPFAAGATASDPDLDCTLESTVREIRVLGETAWLWTEFSLRMTNQKTGKTSASAGHTLSILVRVGDGWRVIRESITMASVPAG